MSDNIFYRFDDCCDATGGETNNEISNDISPFDPVEILFETYDKDFIILSSLDYFFNFTQTLGSALSPQEIDENFHVFNLTSRRGYSQYVLYRRPAGFVFEFFYKDNQVFLLKDPLIKNPFLRDQNLQFFSNIESFADIKKTGQYPDIIILESSFFKFITIDLMRKLVDMMKTLKYNTSVTFFILDLDFDLRVFEYLSYIEAVFSRCSDAYFVIPPGVPFYEKRYFLCFAFRPVKDSTKKTEKTFSDFVKWLEKMLTLRKSPNLHAFPYRYIVSWNILRATGKITHKTDTQN